MSDEYLGYEESRKTVPLCKMLMRRLLDKGKTVPLCKMLMRRLLDKGNSSFMQDADAETPRQRELEFSYLLGSIEDY